VARILLNMLKLWPQMADSHRYVLYFDEAVPEDECLHHPYFEHRVIRGPRFLIRRRTLAEQVFLPTEIRRDNLDLFFGSYYSAPLVCPCPKTVVAAWDISYTTHPRHYTWRASRQMSFFSRRSCRRAEGVVTCSPYDGRQIEKYYGVPALRICVLRLAADDKFSPMGSDRLEALRAKYRLPGRYLLSMGVILNRRNVDVIIDAFKEAYQELPDVGLVVAGHNTTEPRIDIEGRMKPLIAEARGAYIPWVPEDELADFYSGAWYYICTSTVDGEAMMLKEAMRCGTPVITSPLLEEVVEGHAVILQDPTDRTQMAELFRRVIPSVDLRERNALEGRNWVRTLSWKDVARTCLEFFESR
jgi:glycosyltransferase involved in cell wall biosynthesis